MESDSQKAKFFRQSGWMVICTFLGGACMFAVHFFAPFLGDTEYGLLGTLLAMMNVMMIPALGLQTTLAQEAAASITDADRAKFSGTVRGLLFWTLMLWLSMAIFILIFQKHFLETLTISNPIALWLVVLIGLGLLWQPIIQGVLQGVQNFLWLGWVLIINGAGRLIAAALLLLIIWKMLGQISFVSETTVYLKLYNLFYCKALGAIAGALIGIASAIIVGLYQIRSIWLAKHHLPFEWKKWLTRLIPLTVGLGTFQFIFSIDMIIVRALYGEQQTGFYSASGMIGRGLVMFTAPLAAVMFPKIVQSAVQKRKTNVLFLTLISTAILGTIAAGFCTLISKILILSVSQPSAVQWFMPYSLLNGLQKHSEAVTSVGTMIPWFVWCMLPLAVANVLLNNLLARMDYRVVPYLVLVVGVYANAAICFGTSFVRVIQILGVFNLIYLGVLLLFTKLYSRTDVQGNETTVPAIS
ncbi:MAG: hypothetical protein N2487_00815 [Verrucomicrobiae bacterium]|nr:hypothetical protein [Verrucomicrobiae bacterium]